MLGVEGESPVGGLVCLAATLLFLKVPFSRDDSPVVTLPRLPLFGWCRRVPGEMEPALNGMLSYWLRDELFSSLL